MSGRWGHEICWFPLSRVMTNVTTDKWEKIWNMSRDVIFSLTHLDSCSLTKMLWGDAWLRILHVWDWKLLLPRLYWGSPWNYAWYEFCIFTSLKWSCLGLKKRECGMRYANIYPCWLLTNVNKPSWSCLCGWWELSYCTMGKSTFLDILLRFQDIQQNLNANCLLIFVRLILRVQWPII